MPNTPLMNMPLPVPSTTQGIGVAPAGQSWGELYNQDLGIVDGHNHAPGFGAPVPSSGIAINADLPINGNNLTLLRSVRMSSQASPLALGTDLGCLYVSGVDLYFNDTSGNQIRITSAGGVAGTPGSIGGLASPAAATYTVGSKQFEFTSSSGVRANMSGGPLSIYDPQAGGHRVTVNVPVGLSADYAVTFPSALPAAPKIVTLDNTGAIASTTDVDGTTLQLSGSVLSVKALGIGTGQVAAQAITAAKIANGTITNTQQSFGTPSTTSDVAIKSYVDGLITSVQTLTWSNNGVSFFWAKDSFGIVHLRGSFVNIAGFPNQSGTTLPAGFRPSTNRIFPVIVFDNGGNPTNTYVTINSGGLLTFHVAAIGNSFCDGITFLGEQ